MRRLAVLILALVVLAPAFAKDQPEPKPLAPPLIIRWSNNLPWRPLIAWRSTETSTPVVVGDTVYVGSARGRAVFSVDTKNGHVRWNKTVPGRVESTVAVGDERVYVGDSKGWLYALSVEDGRTLWKENLGGVILGEIVFDDGTLYLLTADNRLHARNAGTGEERWVYRHEVPTGITIYGASSPVLSEGRVIAGFSDGTVVAVRRTDGGAAWSQRLVRQGRFRDIDSHPTVADGKVYVSAYSGKIYCLNASNGVEVWSEDPGGTTRVSVADTSIVYGTDAGEVIARSTEDGHILWRHKLRRGLPNTPVITNGTVWVASSSGPMVALELETGAQKWRYDPLLKLSGFNTPMVVDGQRLYAMSNSGTLFSLAPQARRALKFKSAKK